jgi:hypothetical protein
MGTNTRIIRKSKISRLIPGLGLITAAAALCLLLNCSGGFGANSEETKELGPGIFGPDSARR